MCAAAERYINLPPSILEATACLIEWQIQADERLSSGIV